MIELYLTWKNHDVGVWKWINDFEIDTNTMIEIVFLCATMIITAQEKWQMNPATFAHHRHHHRHHPSHFRSSSFSISIISFIICHFYDNINLIFEFVPLFLLCFCNGLICLLFQIFFWICLSLVSDLVAFLVIFLTSFFDECMIEMNENDFFFNDLEIDANQHDWVLVCKNMTWTCENEFRDRC